MQYETGEDEEAILRFHKEHPWQSRGLMLLSVFILIGPMILIAIFYD